MELAIDNKGEQYLFNNWSARGNTRHMETRVFFLLNLQEDLIIKVKWIKGTKNPIDMFTKNLPEPAYNKCAKFL